MSSVNEQFCDEFIEKLNISLDDKPQESIKDALDRFEDDPDLIGDFSAPHVLPTIPGKHSDLKSIVPKTLQDLLDGKYENFVRTYQIFDCRYPYEYEGGHIIKARNTYTHTHILEFLSDKQKKTSSLKEIKSVNNSDDNNSTRDILIFHCEFSSERGPTLARLLRKKDREHNVSEYPKLHFPEIYILDGGYKNFFNEFPKTCFPKNYVPMLHPDYTDELKLYISLSTIEKDHKKRRPSKLKRYSKSCMLLSTLGKEVTRNV